MKRCAGQEKISTPRRTAAERMNGLARDFPASANGELEMLC
jgi:hypothetical protein